MLPVTTDFNQFIADKFTEVCNVLGLQVEILNELVPHLVNSENWVENYIQIILDSSDRVEVKSKLRTEFCLSDAAADYLQNITIEQIRTLYELVEKCK